MWNITRTLCLPLADQHGSAGMEGRLLGRERPFGSLRRMRAVDTEHYWMAARFERREGWDGAIYPFNLPVVRDLDELAFHPKVTFLVGENGSGKSTLIEALAIAWGFNAEGGSQNFNFDTRASHSILHQFVRPVRSARRARDGYFLRAESHFTVSTQIEELGVGDSYGGVPLHE